MTEDESLQSHIQYTFNAFYRIVIRHAAIDKILKLRRWWEREVSLDYLMNEKFARLAEPESMKNIFLPHAARLPFCTMRNLPLPQAHLVVRIEKMEEEKYNRRKNSR